MILSAICCTWNRPQYLGELIESFLRQDYPKEKRELVILDDAGQYGNRDGAGWKIISVGTRFTTLGEKRNASAALVRPDCEGLLVADDDDFYLPHWFSAHAKALEQAEWSWPDTVYIESEGKLQLRKTNGIFHGAHAFRRKTFNRFGGYAAMDSGQDQELFSRLNQANVSVYDTCTGTTPYYIYRFRRDTPHISAMGKGGYQRLRNTERQDACFEIGWKRDYRDWIEQTHQQETDGGQK